MNRQKEIYEVGWWIKLTQDHV